jgi:hypothetical protein
MRFIRRWGFNEKYVCKVMQQEYEWKKHKKPAKVVNVDATDVVQGISEHSYHVEDVKVAKDIIAVLRGESSDKIPDRQYVPHANKFRLF